MGVFQGSLGSVNTRFLVVSGKAVFLNCFPGSARAVGLGQEVSIEIYRNSVNSHVSAASRVLAVH